MNNDLGIDLKEVYKKHFPTDFYSDKSSSECDSETDYEEFRPISLLDAYDDKVLHCFPEPASKLETKPAQDNTNNNISKKIKKQKNEQNASKDNGEPQKCKQSVATNITKEKQIILENNLKISNSYSSLFTEDELETFDKNLDKIKHDSTTNKKIKSVIKNVPLSGDIVDNDKIVLKKKDGKEKERVSEKSGQGSKSTVQNKTSASKNVHLEGSNSKQINKVILQESSVSKNVQLEGNKLNQINKVKLQESSVSKNGQTKENSSKTKGKSNTKVIQAELKNSTGKINTKQTKSKEVSVATEKKNVKEKASVPIVEQKKKKKAAGKTGAKEIESSNGGNDAKSKKTKNASVSNVEQNEVLKSTGIKVTKETKLIELKNEKSDGKSLKKNKNASVPKVVQEIKNLKENKSEEPSISKKINAEDKNSSTKEKNTKRSSVAKIEKAVDNTIETKSVNDNKTEAIKTSNKQKQKTESLVERFLSYSKALQNKTVVSNKNKKKASGNKSETKKEKDVSKVDNPANLDDVHNISNEMVEYFKNISKKNIKTIPLYCENDFPPLKKFKIVENKISTHMHDVRNVDRTENNGKDLERAEERFSLDDNQNVDSNEFKEKDIENLENELEEFEINNCEEISENEENITVINNVTNNIQETYEKEFVDELNTESKLKALELSVCENPEENVMEAMIADIEKNRDAKKYESSKFLNENIGIIQPNSSFSVENEDTISISTSFVTADITSNESSIYLSFSSNDTSSSTSTNLNNSLKELSSTSTDILSIDSENVSTQIISIDDKSVKSKSKRKRNKKKKKKQLQSSEEACEINGDNLIKGFQMFDSLLKEVFSNKPELLGGLFDICDFETLNTSNTITNKQLCSKQEIADENKFVKALIKKNERETKSEKVKTSKPSGYLQMAFKMIDGKDLSECPMNELSAELLSKQFMCGELSLEEIWYFKMGQKSYLHCLKSLKNKQPNDKQGIGDKSDSVKTATEINQKENKGEQTTCNSMQSTKEKEHIKVLNFKQLCFEQEIADENEFVRTLIKGNERKTKIGQVKKPKARGYLQMTFKMVDGKDLSECPMNELSAELLSKQFMCGELSLEEIWYFKMGQKSYLHCLKLLKNKQLNNKQRIGDKNDSVITAMEMNQKENKGEHTTCHSMQSTKEKEHIEALYFNLEKSLKNKKKKKVANASKQNESSETNYGVSDVCLYEKESSKISLDETYVELLATQFLCGLISIEEIWYLRMGQSSYLHKLGVTENTKSIQEKDQKVSNKSKTHKVNSAATSKNINVDDVIKNFGDVDYVAMQRVPVEYSIDYVYTFINQDLISMCDDQIIRRNIKYTLNDNTGEISYE